MPDEANVPFPLGSRRGTAHKAQCRTGPLLGERERPAYDRRREDSLAFGMR